MDSEEERLKDLSHIIAEGVLDFEKEWKPEKKEPWEFSFTDLQRTQPLYTQLMDENKRLNKENEKLRKKVDRLLSFTGCHRNRIHNFT